MEGKSIPRFIKAILRNKEKGKVLDLGAGLGRNSIILAERGFDVTAVDKNKDNLKKLKGKINEKGLKIKIVGKDIRRFLPKEKYDVILSSYVLHFLDKKNVDKVIEVIKSHTKKGGLNVILVFTEDNPDKGFPYLFKRDELKKYYSGWDIFDYKEFMTPFETHGGKLKPHRHAVAVLFAKS